MIKRNSAHASKVNHELLINAEVGQIFEGFTNGETDPDKAYDRLVGLAKKDAAALTRILIRRLRSSDAIMAKVATWSLQALSLREAVNPLMDLMLDGGASDFARVAAMSLLQEMQVDVDQQAVLGSLHDPYAMMEQFTQDFIDLLLDPRISMEDIIGEFNDFNVEMQMEYVALLSRRREPRVALFLWYLQDSGKDEQVTEAARLTLKKLRMAGVPFIDPVEELSTAPLCQAVVFRTRGEGLLHLHLSWELANQVEMVFFTLDYRPKGLVEFYHGQASREDYPHQLTEYLQHEGVQSVEISLHEAKILLAEAASLHKRSWPHMGIFQFLMRGMPEYSDSEIRALNRRLVSGPLGPSRLMALLADSIGEGDFGLVWDLFHSDRCPFTRDGFVKKARKQQREAKAKWKKIETMVLDSRSTRAEGELAAELQLRGQHRQVKVSIFLKRRNGEWGIDEILVLDGEWPIPI